MRHRRARVARTALQPAKTKQATPACAAEEGVAWVAQRRKDGAVDKAWGR